jgi:hypothetical protein
MRVLGMVWVVGVHWLIPLSGWPVRRSVPAQRGPRTRTDGGPTGRRTVEWFVSARGTSPLDQEFSMTYFIAVPGLFPAWL